MSSRRSFLKQVVVGGTLTAIPNWAKAIGDEEVVKLTILHTNDMHSRIDSFPDNHSTYPGMGGLAKRSAVINKVRSQEEHVLLFDAGDIFQGTPYFNEYGGSIELTAMNKMQYDAVTIGNHDFDMGIDHLANSIKSVNFPYLNANYSFKETPLNEIVPPYQIFEKAGLKIGVFGLGVELQGLVDSKLYSQTKYLDPIEISNKISEHLKHSLHCDLVVCLSHLGYTYNDSQVSDLILAQKSKNIDLIIGGHTHTFLEKPTIVKNAKNHSTIVNQVGWAGLFLGQIDFYFHPKIKFPIFSPKVHFLDKK
jgi:5'-nucleotidase